MIRGRRDMADWSEAAAAVGGGLLATVTSWLLGRSDSARSRRVEEMRDVAEKVISEQKVDVRLNTLEIVLPRVEEKIDETHDMVRSLHELALTGRLPIRKKD